MVAGPEPQTKRLGSRKLDDQRLFYVSALVIATHLQVLDLYHDPRNYVRKFRTQLVCRAERVSIGVLKLVGFSFHSFANYNIAFKQKSCQQLPYSLGSTLSHESPESLAL
eukprot:4148648-Amphidinium_carterae.1